MGGKGTHVALRKHPYEDPHYWSSRTTSDGVATLGWSADLNEFYYLIKERYADRFVKSAPVLINFLFGVTLLTWS